MKSGGQYYWYHNDHLGTPQMMTTSSGAVVWSATYTSFGKAFVDGGFSVVNPLRLPGQYEDTETGLHYNWHRYYDPQLGRYFQSDPTGLTPEDNLLIEHINHLYIYSKDNPINLFDPRGLKPLSLKCVKKVVKIFKKCGGNATQAWLSFWRYLNKCQDEWRKCFDQGKTSPGSCPTDDDPCKKFKGCNGPSQARFRCAKNSEEWKKIAAKTFDKECTTAVVSAGITCLNPK
jgi:RHS repeat-associated protein